jgi:hypothetical protein
MATRIRAAFARTVATAAAAALANRIPTFRAAERAGRTKARTSEVNATMRKFTPAQAGAMRNRSSVET